ncbi:MAG TPA: tetratricopeptide repeat protein, partial [Bacteroidia bacterium]|nr:tetratricopeptide repeat protein [Bacteroidia bacterium]
LGDKHLQAKIFGNLGNIYSDQGDYPKSLDYYLKALAMGEESGDKQLQTSELSNIGIVYTDQGDYSKALEYDLKALNIAQELGNKHLQANIFDNIGIAYWNKGDYPKALSYNLNALKMAKEIEEKGLQANALLNIGNVYNSMANLVISHQKSKRDSLYKQALNYYAMALKIVEEIGDKSRTAIILGNMGSIYSQIEEYKESELYLKRSISISDSIGDRNDLRQMEEGLSQLYDTTGRYKLALEFYKKAMILKDTLFNADKNKALTRKEMTYEFEKKEAAQKAEQNKKDALAEADKRKQRIVTWSVCGGLVLVLAFAGFIFRSLRITNKQKILIERKNKVIEEKNKDILDSINYAKRLQDAILPPLSLVAKYLPQSFVLYKPKDI